jgi:hypothetical protein
MRRAGSLWLTLPRELPQAVAAAAAAMSTMMRVIVVVMTMPAKVTVVVVVLATAAHQLVVAPLFNRLQRTKWHLDAPGQGLQWTLNSFMVEYTLLLLAKVLDVVISLRSLNLLPHQWLGQLSFNT